MISFNPYSSSMRQVFRVIQTWKWRFRDVKSPVQHHHWGVVELEDKLKQSDSRAHILKPWAAPSPYRDHRTASQSSVLTLGAPGRVALNKLLYLSEPIHWPLMFEWKEKGFVGSWVKWLGGNSTEDPSSSRALYSKTA